MLVKLKCGTQFAGWWAGSSFASDDKADRDLLIEQVFEVPDAGPWKPTDKSVLIMAGEIQTIEFTPEDRNEPDVKEASYHLKAGNSHGERASASSSA